MPREADPHVARQIEELCRQFEQRWRRGERPDVGEYLQRAEESQRGALLRLHQEEQVWPLLAHQPDPRLRSYLLDRLASLGADPESLWQRLSVEQDDSTRRALIQGLGEFAASKLLSAAQEASISAGLLRLYQEDPDPGIHGVAEWTLRQLGQQAGLDQIRSALATGQRIGDRRCGT